MINEGTGAEDVMPDKGMRQLKQGYVYCIRSSGGGGWGKPYERDAEQVADDVRNEYVSLEVAERIYGVVIKDGKVDEQATAELRGST